MLRVWTHLFVVIFNVICLTINNLSGILDTTDTSFVDPCCEEQQCCLFREPRYKLLRWPTGGTKFPNTNLSTIGKPTRGRGDQENYGILPLYGAFFLLLPFICIQKGSVWVQKRGSENCTLMAKIERVTRPTSL